MNPRIAPSCVCLPLLLTLALGSLSGCVVVDPKPRVGVIRAPQPAQTKAQPGASPSAKLPDGPVAKPAATSEVADARVVVGVRPIGRVPYDGMSLPLISPDGRFIAVQTGQAPPWEALLAQPGVAVAPATTLAAFAVVQPTNAAGTQAATAGPSVQAIAWPQSPGPGLVLGRSADAQGFLVESYRDEPAGARWIGRVDWVTGKLTWLVQGDSINAFATFGPSGELIYSRLNADRDVFELVIRRDAASSATETVVRMPNPSSRESLVFPLCSLDAKNVYAISMPPNSGASLSIVAITLPTSSSPGGTIGSRRSLNVESTLAAAFQCVAPMQTPWRDRSSSAFSGPIAEGVAIVSASARAVVWFDPSRGLSTLATNSACAVPLRSSDRSGVERAGLLVATGRELAFQAISDAADASSTRWSRETSVLSGAAVPRVVMTASSDARFGQFLLFEPTKPGMQGSNGAWLSAISLVPMSGEEP